MTQFSAKIFKSSAKFSSQNSFRFNRNSLFLGFAVLDTYKKCNRAVHRETQELPTAMCLSQKVLDKFRKFVSLEMVARSF